MKNISANKVIVLAACASSTASSKTTAAALSTTTSRGAPWVVTNISRGGSKSSNDDEAGAKSKKAPSTQNRSGKKKKSTKTTREETKSTNFRGKSDIAEEKSAGNSSNPLLEEIVGYDDLYDVLGISKTATDREIQKAYRKRCVQTHPDKTGGDRRAFDKVAEAYEILSEPSKRQTYNQYGKAGLDPTNPNNGATFGGGGAASDMFQNMFRQAQQQRQQQQRRNQTLRYQLEVTLEDLYYGRTQNVMVAPPLNRHMSYHQQRRQRKEVEVHIEKGSLSGQSIVMSGEVDFNDDNSPPGDLVFILTQAPHATFTRKGHDLAMELTISLEESLCGLRRSIQHLDGSDLWIESTTRQFDQSGSQNSKAGKTKSVIDNDNDIDNNDDDVDDISSSIPIMIRTGDVQVLKGRGMPKRNQNGDFGDLYIQYRVEMPLNSKGRSVGNELTKEEYKELSRILTKLEECNGMNSSRRKDVGNRRNKEEDERKQDELPPPKIHALREAKPSDFGTASGKVTWEEEEGPGGSFREEQDFNPFGSNLFGGQGFGGGRTFSQGFQFGGAGGPFGGGPFGSAPGEDDDGNAQCQQM